MIKYTERNKAIASGATFAQNQWYDTLKIFRHVLPLSLAYKIYNLYNVLKEPKTFDPADICAQLQKLSALKEHEIFDPADTCTKIWL